MAQQSTPLAVQQHSHQTKNGLAQLPRITIGTHDFPSIRREGTLLVDKTAKIAELVKTNKVFLVRPHSFGKSMLLAMLKKLFAHGTDKFEGLAIHDTWPETRCYPVIRLSLNARPNPQTFEQSLCIRLRTELALAGFSELKERTQEITTLEPLLEAIKADLCAQETVWLIDAWDHALSHRLDDEAAFEANYRVINTLLDGLNRLSNLRFLLVTGVGSYRAASLFPASDFTNISQHPYFADLLGYTQAEVETNFAPYIARACEVLGLSRDELLAQLKYHYGGFCFDHNAAVALYNPLAINNFFQQFMNPDSRATPAFYPFWMANHNASAALSSCLKSRPVDLSFLAQATSNELRITQEQFATPAGCDQVDLKSLMLQTGLLTFKSVVNPKCHNLHERTYRCGFPNWEVESCCVSTFLKFLTTASSREWIHLPLKLKSAFQSWDLEQAVETLNTSLSWVPEAVWSQSSELTYRAFIYSVLICSNLTPLRSEPDHQELDKHGASADPLEFVFDHKLLLLVPKLLPAHASQQDCLALAQQAQEQIVARAAQGFDPNSVLWPKPPFKEHQGLVLVLSDDSHQIVYWRLLSLDQAPEQVPEQASEPVLVLAEGWDSPQLNSKTIEAILVCAQPQEDQTTDEAELIIDSNALVKGFTKLARQLLAPSVSMSADAIKDMVRALVDGAQNLSASSLRSVDRDVLVAYLVAYLEVLLSSR